MCRRDLRELQLVDNHPAWRCEMLWHVPCPAAASDKGDAAVGGLGAQLLLWDRGLATKPQGCMPSTMSGQSPHVACGSCFSASACFLYVVQSFSRVR